MRSGGGGGRVIACHAGRGRGDQWKTKSVITLWWAEVLTGGGRGMGWGRCEIHQHAATGGQSKMKRYDNYGPIILEHTAMGTFVVATRHHGECNYSGEPAVRCFWAQHYTGGLVTTCNSCVVWLIEYGLMSTQLCGWDASVQNPQPGAHAVVKDDRKLLNLFRVASN